MKEAITNLTKQENHLLQTILDQHQVDPSLASKTNRYYRELRRLNYHKDHSLPIASIMSTALVIAQQSHPVYNMQGQSLGSVCLLANRMLGSKQAAHHLSQGIKLYLTGIKAHEHELKINLIQLQQQINFGLHYITKFERAMKYFNFVELVGETHQYLHLFNSFSWLLFLFMHRTLKTQNQAQTDYLLISVLYIMVRYGYDYVRPKSAPSLNNHKHIITNILNQLFQIFQIDHPQLFKQITSQVDQQFENLIARGIIKYTCSNYDFLSPELIHHNYRKIDLLYQKFNNPHSLDYRLILQNRQQTLTPVKNNHPTPTKNIPQKVVDKRNAHKAKGNHTFASHKILNFNDEEFNSKDISQHKEESFRQQTKLPANVRVSPSLNKTPLICVRRPSPGSSIQQFMIRTIKQNQYGLEILQNQKQILEVIKNIIVNTHSSRINEKIRTTYNYFLSIIAMFLHQEIFDEDDYNGIHCSCLIHSILFILAAQSVPQDYFDFVKESMSKIRMKIVANGYELWLVAKSIKSRQGGMPSQIKHIIEAVQQLIITEIIWEQQSCFQIEKYSESFDFPSTRSQNMQILISDILVYSKKCIDNFSEEISQQPLSSNLMNHLKYIVINCSTILIDKNLHQMILCLCYLHLRKNNINISFNQIIINYQKSNSIENEQLNAILSNINYEGQDLINIIQFYNKVFLPFVKNHLEHLPSEYFTSFIQPYHEEVEIKTKKGQKCFRREFSHSQFHKQKSFYEQLRHQTCQVRPFSPQIPKQNFKNQENQIQPIRDHTRQRERPSLGAIIGNQTLKGKNPRISN